MIFKKQHIFASITALILILLFFVLGIIVSIFGYFINISDAFLTSVLGYIGLLTALTFIYRRNMSFKAGIDVADAINLSLDNLRHLDKDVQEDILAIKKLYEDAITSQYSYPEASLVTARKTAEAICKHLYLREISSTFEKYTFDEMLSLLIKQKIIPPKIAVPIRTVQGYGNYASHHQAENVGKMSVEYVQSCLHSLTTIVTWYFHDYLKK